MPITPPSAQSTTAFQPKLIEGRGGIFDVAVDGQRIYSKHETGRFPTNDEILAKLGTT
jgi:selenoprotein W-related protein